MRFYEILTEQLLTEAPVMSSWISDLTLVDDNSGDVVMALLNGTRYRVLGVGPNMYGGWMKSGSKGKFWHNNIKKRYKIRRLI